MQCNHFPPHEFLVLVWFRCLIVRDDIEYIVQLDTAPVISQWFCCTGWLSYSGQVSKKKKLERKAQRLLRLPI